MLRILFSLLALVTVLNGQSKTVYDSPNVDAKRLFLWAKTKYVIRYGHTFKDTVKVPEGCELLFDGGSLVGPIVFNETKLSGRVNLKGSSLSGSVSNNLFDASWLCHMDGKTDDAKQINEIISICRHIYFPKGEYRLVSAFNPSKIVSRELHKSIKSHIGVYQSDVFLEGEKGCCFITSESLGTICIFSKPYNIDNNIKNVKIQKITFKVINDGVKFHEFLHTIKTIGVNGLTIENCIFDDFWGDAICLSHYGDDAKTGERTRNQNVRIVNNQIEGGKHFNNRNGISVINGKNILIKGNVIRNTSRKDMPGGICVEPNNSAYTIDGIKVFDNTFHRIKGNGGAICVVLLRDNAPAHNIEIKSNSIWNSSCGMTFVIKTNNSSDHFSICDNFIDKETKPYSFSGGGETHNWKILRNRFKKKCIQKIPGNIKIKELEVKNLK